MIPDILQITIGFIIGILSGMFGFGGSSISTPILRIFLETPPYYALASPLPMSVISSSVASIKYHREELIDWAIVKNVLFLLIPGSILGAYLTKFISGKILMLLTSLFLFYISFRFILDRKKSKKIVRNRSIIWIVGFFIGFVSGMLANGGGILVVPLLVLLGIRIKKAIASSMAIVLLGSLPAIAIHTYLGHINWMLTIFLSIGAIPASYIGAHITVKVDKDKLRIAYGLFILIFSVYFAIFEIMGIA